MIYRSVIAAVVRALASETMSSTGGQDFEPKVQAAKQKGAIVGKEAALLVDCIAYKLLHAQLSPVHWDSLVARYGTHKEHKVQSLSALQAIIAAAAETPAPKLFLYKAVTAWAIPQLKGARPKVVNSVSVEIPLDAPDWRRESMVKAAVAAGKAKARKDDARSADMIVLKDSFYDMNTWDNQGLTERTYQRWNKAIRDQLDGLVNEALVEAQHLLEAVGALEKEVA